MEKNLFGKLFPKNIKFWAKSQGIVGVDIGSSSIKVVQLKKEKEQAVLETYGELATGPYANAPVGQIVKLEENTVAGMLKDLVKESGITSKEAAVSIPVKDSLVTIIKLPLVSEKEMDEVVKFEARKYIPVPLSEVDLDWWILQPEKQAEKKTMGKKKRKTSLKRKKKWLKCFWLPYTREWFKNIKPFFQKPASKLSCLR